jgi:DNA-binding HxlR family transcriptional regulator
VGGKWKLIATMRVKDGIARFGDLQRSLPGISRKQLAQCLRELARDGVIERVEAHPPSRSVHYAITPLGAQLQHSATALYDWGNLWLSSAGTKGPPHG